jgi:hypothetical protein
MNVRPWVFTLNTSIGAERAQLKLKSLDAASLAEAAAAKYKRQGSHAHMRYRHDHRPATMLKQQLVKQCLSRIQDSPPANIGNAITHQSLHPPR